MRTAERAVRDQISARAPWHLAGKKNAAATPPDRTDPVAYALVQGTGSEPHGGRPGGGPRSLAALLPGYSVTPLLRKFTTTTDVFDVELDGVGAKIAWPEPLQGTQRVVGIGSRVS